MAEHHPRCGKCRIVHPYDWTIEEGDDPRFTKINANPAGVCAEDLARYEIETLGLRADNELPELPECEPKLFPEVECYGEARP